MKTIHATEDQSVNFVERIGEGFHESRYVRRTGDYAIAYLSSHNGCDRACRFCHLTATGQTSMQPATEDELIAQLVRVLDHARMQPPAERLNINFMARGEPLLNPILRDVGLWTSFRHRARDLASAAGFPVVQFNVSTTMPEDCPDIAKVFADAETVLYYSLYSTRTSFRKRWLPRTLSPVRALIRLGDWSRSSGRQLVIHHAFIQGENDDGDTLHGIHEAISASHILPRTWPHPPRFNLVRYNPPNDKSREASDKVLQRNLLRMGEILGNPAGARMVTRVGFSAKASCGMFVHPAEMESA